MKEERTRNRKWEDISVTVADKLPDNSLVGAQPEAKDLAAFKLFCLPAFCLGNIVSSAVRPGSVFPSVPSVRPSVRPTRLAIRPRFGDTQESIYVYYYTRRHKLRKGKTWLPCLFVRRKCSTAAGRVE